jgi:hypothetical protein
VRAQNILTAKQALRNTYDRVPTADTTACTSDISRVVQAASVWPKLSAELLRGICTHAAQKEPKRIGSAGGVRMETDVVHGLQNLARSLNIPIRTRKNQACYDGEERQTLLRMLSDPRFEMQALLVTVSSFVRAYRVMRSHLRIDGDTLHVCIDVGGKDVSASIGDGLIRTLREGCEQCCPPPIQCMIGRIRQAAQTTRCGRSQVGRPCARTCVEWATR